MISADMKINLETDTSDLQNQLNGLVENGSSADEQMTTNGSYQQLNDSIQEVIKSFKALAEIEKTETQQTAQQSSIPSPISVNGLEGMLSAKTEKNEIDRKDKELQTTNSMISAANVGNSIIASLTRGDPAGAFIKGVDTVGQGMASGGQKLKQSDNSILGEVGGIISKAAIPILIGGTLLKGGQMLSEKYEDALPEISTLYRTFGNKELSREANSNMGLGMWEKVQNFNTGTNLTTQEFSSLVSSFGRYGINNETQAALMAQKAGQLSNYTGADVNTIASFSGLIERYGGDGNKTLENAYKAAKTTGLEDGQFGEFLNGILRVMEDGIARGFVKSADEVNDTLTAFASYSNNNELWIGEQGAKKYAQMSNSAAANTHMESVSSILMVQAANEIINNDDFNEAKVIKDSNSIINALAYIEKGGTDTEFLKAFYTNLTNTHGNNEDFIIKDLKEAYGLNWNGAAELYDILRNMNEDEKEERLKDWRTAKESGEYSSDETKLQEALNKLSTEMASLGKKPFDIKIGAMEDTKNLVEKIVNILDLDGYSQTVKQIRVDYYGVDSKIGKEWEEKTLKNLETPHTRQSAINEIEEILKTDPNKMRYLNAMTDSNSNWNKLSDERQTKLQEHITDDSKFEKFKNNKILSDGTYMFLNGQLSADQQQSVYNEIDQLESSKEPDEAVTESKVSSEEKELSSNIAKELTDSIKTLNIEIANLAKKVNENSLSTELNTSTVKNVNISYG